MQKYIGLLVIIPMLIVGIVPILTGQIDWSTTRRSCRWQRLCAEPGAWDIAGWTLVLGGMFIAAWSTYAFETAICYTSEFREPEDRHVQGDLLFRPALPRCSTSLVPFTFQGVLGLDGMLRPGIVDGTGVADAMAQHGRRRRLHQRASW